MLCVFCKFAAPFVEVEAKFTVYGTSVCEEHIDTPSGDFGRDLLRLNKPGYFS